MSKPSESGSGSDGKADATPAPTPALAAANVKATAVSAELKKLKKQIITLKLDVLKLDGSNYNLYEFKTRSAIHSAGSAYDLADLLDSPEVDTNKLSELGISFDQLVQLCQALENVLLQSLETELSLVVTTLPRWTWAQAKFMKPADFKPHKSCKPEEIMPFPHPSTIWLEMKNRFYRQDPAQALNLQDQLRRVKMVSGKPLVQAFLDVVAEISRVTRSSTAWRALQKTKSVQARK